MSRSSRGAEARQRVADDCSQGAGDRLQDDRRVADSERQKAVQKESAWVRAEVEKTWAAKLREANDTADQRFESVLCEANEAADRSLELRIDQVREETKRTIVAELAGNEASRAAVLSVQGDRVRGWRFVGFGPTVDDEGRQQVDLECGEAGIVGRAVVMGEACSVVSGPNGMPGGAEPAFTPLPPGVRALSVPVLVSGEVMAVVYGDDAKRYPAVA